MRAAVVAPSAGELARAVREGRVTGEELVEQALDRLAAVDGEVRSFVHVDVDGARAQVRAAVDGPLRGVPVAVKDLFDVAGQVTRAGSLVPAGPAAVRDATAVARLRAAGAVVLGRTRTHEYAWGITTQHEVLGGTGNPWDTTRVPGGSSGGSAAAVAAGIVPLALGTDTGCSIRLPAAWCGLVGHKPTWGTVPLDGCIPLASSLDHGGALVRTVADVRLVLRVLAGLDLRPPEPVRGLRAGVVRASTDGASGSVTAALEAAYGRADAAGLLLREVVLPSAERLGEAYAGTQAGEALAWHTGTGRWPASREVYGGDVRRSLDAAVAGGPAQVAAAAVLRAELRREAAALFEHLDVLLLPVASSGPSTRARAAFQPGTAEPLRQAVLPWTVLANLCGLPACSVPAGLDDDGLPVGVQVVGAPGQDALVLDVADAVQAALPWS